MSNWKIVLSHNGKNVELIIKAKSYSEAYLNVGVEYPESRILSIKLIKRPANKKNK
jgi:hypothetical protein